jgi:hypothetical protein
MPHPGHRIGRNCQSAGAEKSFSFRHFALLLWSLQIFEAIAFRRPERVEPVLLDRKLTFRAVVETTDQRYRQTSRFDVLPKTVHRRQSRVGIRRPMTIAIGK